MLRIAETVAAAAMVAALPLASGGNTGQRQDDADGLGWRVSMQPYALTITQSGRTVLAEHGGTTVPGNATGYSLVDGARHRLTRVVSQRPLPGGEELVVATTEPGRTAVVRLTRTRRAVEVSLRIEPPDRVAAVFESFRAAGDEHFTGTGGREARVDLRGLVVPIKTWNLDCRSGVAVPFYLSSAGYGAWFRTDAVGRFAFPGSDERTSPRCELGTSGCAVAAARSTVQACFKAAAIRYDVYTGPPAAVLAAYTAAAGRPRLPPRAQFALMQWRDDLPHGRDALADVDRLRSLGIPVGWVVVDNPWEEQCVGTLEFDRERFPDPAGTVAELAARGVRTLLWVSPVVRATCAPAGYVPGQLVGEGDWLTVDLTRADAAAELEHRLDRLLGVGVAGFKGDRGDEVDLERRPLAAGSGTELHNAVPRLFAAVAAGVVRRHRPGDGVVLARAATAGSQQHLTGIWAGDQKGTWEGLRAAIRLAQTSGMSGLPVWGSDVGGYDSGQLTTPVFVRWAQLGALSPIFEVGGKGPNGQPWELGEDAVEALRRAAQLHHELFPLLYELARRAAATGQPILRPLGYQFPRDERAWRSDLQLLVGPDLLAGLVADEDGFSPVYLPPGRWIDLRTGATVVGKRSLRLRPPLLEHPLYLRAGAAIPFDARVPDIWADSWRPEELGREGRAGWLVAPNLDGAFEARAAGYGRMRVELVGRALRIALRDAPPETQVLVLVRQPPVSVELDGAAATSEATLPAARSGWLHTRSRFGGVVALKLRPRDGIASAVVHLR